MAHHRVFTKDWLFTFACASREFVSDSCAFL